MELNLIRDNEIYLNREESKTDDEIGNPVDGDGDRSSHGTSRRVEQFSDKEPGDRARTGGEKYHVDDNQDDTEV